MWNVSVTQIQAYKLMNNKNDKIWIIIHEYFLISDTGLIITFLTNSDLFLTEVGQIFFFTSTWYSWFIKELIQLDTNIQKYGASIIPSGN